MTNILCYGDSNTWGWNADGMNRHPRDVRWTGQLQTLMGDDYYVIEEGLNGRTTVWDDPIEEHKNGKTYLYPCLQTHRPLDLVILMLGTNDLKARFSVTAFDIAQGVARLVGVIKESDSGHNGAAPQILLMSPPHLGDMPPDYGEMFSGGREKSTRLARHYRLVADTFDTAFMDTSDFLVADPIDGIHLTAAAHGILARRLAAVVRDLMDG
jgi:lysophospholipase L1-like esterase